MTTEQFRRWQTFALRMAHRGLTTRSGRRLPRKSRRFVAGRIKWFFTVTLRDNESREGPPLRERIVSWDHTDNSGMPRDRCGREPIGPYVCDMVQDLMGDGVNPHYWGRDDAAYEKWDELWGSRVRCCLRAGLDLACEPSAGVLGFTAGDLRRMYRGEPPAWITEGFVSGPLGGPTEPAEFATIGDDEGVWL